MALSRLQITHVRNLDSVKLRGLQQYNIFYGDNGSGKTSALEAIHLLGMARSFRGTRLRSLISHGERACTVFGAIKAGSSETTLGVERDTTAQARIRINGAPERTVAALASYLPLQVLNASSFDLLVGAPASRRQYLDWGVFHVEQSFLATWQNFQRCLRQRNTLLRRGKISTKELHVWSHKLAAAGELLNAAREHYQQQLLPVVGELLAALAPDLDTLEFRFRRGWDRKLSYSEALEAGQATDREQGFTHAGPQRADLRIVTQGHAASEILSRGQQKLVVCALKLAQGKLLSSQGRRRCTYLVDDLPSELDDTRTRLVCEQMANLDAQVFVTCVEKEEIQRFWSEQAQSVALFHVKHGAVTLA